MATGEFRFELGDLSCHRLGLECPDCLMSTFVWIDHSEKQRRQVLEAIDQFREKDTRDELGTASIRDAFSDLLFPGTGALQTRARYFLFVPWMCLQMENKKVPSSEIGRRVREYEIRMIDALAESEDSHGTIGIEARANLQRVPSSIYWNALRALRICEFPGSQADYQRSLDRFYQGRSGVRLTDDKDAVFRRTGNWDTDLPPAPTGLPKEASFNLTKGEATYLRDMVREHHPNSLLRFVVERPVPESGADFVWDLEMIKDADGQLPRQLEHAQCFSEVRQGAAILYNLLLARMTPQKPAIEEKCNGLWQEWLGLMAARRAAHTKWALPDMWQLLDEQQRPIKARTRQFVEQWHALVVLGDPADALESADAHQLIKRREGAIKGALARFDNHRAREMWRGESGLGQLDYRWSNALVLIRDIQEGLGLPNA